MVKRTSSAMFTALLDDTSVTLRAFEVDGDVKVSASDFKASFLKLFGITFTGGLQFVHVDLGVGATFENCNFYKKVVFYNAKAGGYNQSFSKNSVSIRFKDCKFLEGIAFVGPHLQVERAIEFSSCEIKGGLALQGVNINVESLSLTDCTIDGQFDVEESKIHQDVRLTRCRIETRIRIQNLSAESLVLIGCQFEKDVFVKHSLLRRGVNLNDNEFRNTVQFKCVQSSETFSFIGNTFHEQVSILFENTPNTPPIGFQDLYLKDCDFNNGLDVIGGESVGAQTPQVGEIQIAASSKLKGDMRFERLDVGYLALFGYNSSANMLFNGLTVNQLSISAFYNFGQVSFSGLYASQHPRYRTDIQGMIRVPSVFIHNSNLGNTHFFKSDLSGFHHFKINDAMLSNVASSNVVWFDWRRIKHEKEREWIKELSNARKQKDHRKVMDLEQRLGAAYRSSREVFRQLKTAMEKQSDKPQALEFQRWEMTYYKKYLSISHHSSLGDRLILYASETNDFGQNWIKPIILLLVLSFAFYMPIAVLVSSELDHFNPADSWSDVWVTLKQPFGRALRLWPQLLNPAHSLSRIVPDTESLPSVVFYFDFLLRLVVSFFLFQIVAAFRKYHR